MSNDLIKALERIATLPSPRQGLELPAAHLVGEMRRIARETLVAHRSQQEAAQEPVAWQVRSWYEGEGWSSWHPAHAVDLPGYRRRIAEGRRIELRALVPADTSPAPSESAARKPLTDEQITALLIEMNTRDTKADGVSAMFAILVRAVEAAHGITDAAMAASGGESAT